MLCRAFAGGGFGLGGVGAWALGAFGPLGLGGGGVGVRAGPVGSVFVVVVATKFHPTLVFDFLPI